LAPRIAGGYQKDEKPADLLRWATESEVTKFLDFTEHGIVPDKFDEPLAWISTERNSANIALQSLWAKGFI
jgi:hypothetical protein